jgi:DNA-binding GntR family transcriptional regulator
MSGDATEAVERRFDPISSPTLVAAVVEKLRSSILTGRFAAGERLVEAELARELGISRGPIREALAVLEKDGIVVNVPRRGKFLPGFDVHTIDEIYSLRKVLEAYAVELLIERMTPEKEAALLRALAELAEAANSEDLLALAERDIALHSLLYELADHELLLKAWNETIAGKLRMLLNLTIRTHVPLSTAQNHEVIIETIVAGDVKGARRLIVDHVEDAWRRARAAMETSAASAASA